MKTLKPCYVDVAFRNSGEKAPLTVRFVQEKENVSSSVHNLMISMGLGQKRNTTQSVLISFTEESFNTVFGKFGYTADQITKGYGSKETPTGVKLLKETTDEETAEVINVPIDITDVIGKELFISRIDTIDPKEYQDDLGQLRIGYTPKIVNGEHLAVDQKGIYSVFIFTEDGIDRKLQHNSKLVESLQELEALENLDLKPEKQRRTV